MLRFHRTAVDLLPSPPAFSRQNAEIFAERERQLNRTFPASVREWYSLDRSVELLRDYSNCDEPVPLHQLGAPATNWYGAGSRDFVQSDLLWIMAENQGVCNWAVKLNGSDDPPVVVEVDSAPNETWLPLTSSFSEFIYCQIWDHPEDIAQCAAQELELTTTDLEYLHQQFHLGPKSAAWPGNINLRFSSVYGRVLIWLAEDHGADWFLFAHGEEHMVRLIQSVWKCGNLATTLYANDEVATRALTRVRNTTN